MSNRWEYGNAYLRHPIQAGIAIFEDKSALKVHDIFNPLPAFMTRADLLFVDPPWNKGNLSTFYTKADIEHPNGPYDAFMGRLFECVGDIAPRVCYLEVGKQYLADFIVSMRRLYPYVTFYNSTYYHRPNNLCYVVRGSRKALKPALDGVDEEDIIAHVCANEDYTCIGDLCMGRGLVALHAYANGCQFVGTELNHKRLSVALESLVGQGAHYTIQ